MENDLKISGINIEFSGSTCVLILLIKEHAYCINLGDSRAILAKQTKEGWFLMPLSRDQKPSDELESQRIIQAGGRIDQLRDQFGKPVGPQRVWLKNERAPGLAMSRSFGDLVSKTVGVIAEPEIFEFDLIEEDKFLVIGSDGIFEFLSNIQIVQTIIPCYRKNQTETACEKLVKAATAAWKKEELVIDDITCILLFLDIN